MFRRCLLLLLILAASGPARAGGPAQPIPPLPQLPFDAERAKVMGQAETEVTKLKETAKSGLYQLKMDVFQNDSNAFLRYTLADQLNPDLVLRLFHSGTGTFWTNMGDKNMNLMLPMPVASDSKEPKKTDGGKEKAVETGK